MFGHRRLEASLSGGAEQAATSRTAKPLGSGLLSQEFGAGAGEGGSCLSLSRDLQLWLLLSFGYSHLPRQLELFQFKVIPGVPPSTSGALAPSVHFRQLSFSKCQEIHIKNLSALSTLPREGSSLFPHDLKGVFHNVRSP